MPLLPAAIGIVFNADQTQVLLVKRCDVAIWVLPGGGVESQETPEEAVKREIQEETGLIVSIIRQSAEYHPLNSLATLTSVFICHVQAGQLSLSPETQAIAFFPLSQLPANFFHLHAGWLQEALTHDRLIKRPLKEVSYPALAKYCMRHPWLVLRYAWTRFVN
jgi:8-oxo-dGTP diphosphatase